MFWYHEGDESLVDDVEPERVDPFVVVGEVSSESLERDKSEGFVAWVVEVFFSVP